MAADMQDGQRTARMELMIMSGVEDGLLLRFDSANGDGRFLDDAWVIAIGRRDDNDVCLRNDTYISRLHAQLYAHGDRWWLEDCTSKNGTFIEAGVDEARVSSKIPIVPGQLFRIGRTWLRIQPAPADALFTSSTLSEG